VELAHGRVQFHAGLHQRVQHGEAAGEALHRQFPVPGGLGTLVGEKERHRRRALVEKRRGIALAQPQGDLQRARLQFQRPLFPTRRPPSAFASRSSDTSTSRFASAELGLARNKSGRWFGALPAQPPSPPHSYHTPRLR
jgi:hypothetical protein